MGQTSKATHEHLVQTCGIGDDLSILSPQWSYQGAPPLDRGERPLGFEL